MASHKNNSTKGQPEIFIHIERLAFHFIAFKCLLIKMENGNQCQMQRECCSKAFTFTFTLTIAGFLFSSFPFWPSAQWRGRQKVKN